MGKPDASTIKLLLEFLGISPEDEAKVTFNEAANNASFSIVEAKFLDGSVKRILVAKDIATGAKTLVVSLP